MKYPIVYCDKSWPSEHREEKSDVKLGNSVNIITFWIIRYISSPWKETIYKPTKFSELETSLEISRLASSFVKGGRMMYEIKGEDEQTSTWYKQF